MPNLVGAFFCGWCTLGAMKSSARIIIRPTAGFEADPDPSTNPQDVPVGAVFRVAESLPVDGAPSAIQMWLDGAPGAETCSVELWGLDDDSAPQEAAISAPFKPSASHRWSRLAAATVVTSPAVQAVTGRLYSGLVYVRQTASGLTVSHALKVQPARL